MKLTDLKPGDKIRPLSHWDCLSPRQVRVVRKNESGLFVRCALGSHYLDGLEGDDGELENLERVP